jgi:hypothetical protein
MTASGSEGPERGFDAELSKSVADETPGQAAFIDQRYNSAAAWRDNCFESDGTPDGPGARLGIEIALTSSLSGLSSCSAVLEGTRGRVTSNLGDRLE